MKPNDIVITAAYRTPIGKFQGSLKNLSAVDLATQLAQQILIREQFDPQLIDQVILGNVLSTGLGQNLARQVQLNAGLPVAGTALTLNQVCGSGLKALRVAQGALTLGDAKFVLAGGVESMSQAPGFVRRNGKQSFDQSEVIDSLFYDGLNDAFGQYPMGVTAENLNQQYHLTRQQLDEYALLSQQKATQAQTAGHFDAEIIPFASLSQDEVLRPQTTLDALTNLKPVYQAKGSVTAGNSSPLSDGASLLMLTTAQQAQALQLTPLARIVAYQESGYQPELMGYTPVLAIQQLLAQQQQKVEQIDLFEVNEAFASQSLVVQQEVGIAPSQYNIDGGALALGHPLGASGARIVTTLLHQLQRTHQCLGIAALCVGGGQGLAIEVENLQ
ncbi:thiolase family protein [Bombilactobacillus folatiphilus]|uniref:acetyl-CoA C-acetyltransferase n=1 Tax=Bombilactobacillus folatiphilus TaxID=2923362 RepID=A0ABY4P8A0_9LACO|nr:thiolase family protein [Bombilactobacillus folatiphilus]UQS81756.1 thiolase family protein [Bombilactobacillus folatiphilus]